MVVLDATKSLQIFFSVLCFVEAIKLKSKCKKISFLREFNLKKKKQV